MKTESIRAVTAVLRQQLSTEDAPEVIKQSTVSAAAFDCARSPRGLMIGSGGPSAVSRRISGLAAATAGGRFNPTNYMSD